MAGTVVTVAVRALVAVVVGSRGKHSDGWRVVEGTVVAAESAVVHHPGGPAQGQRSDRATA